MLGICSGVCDVLMKRKPRGLCWDVQVIQNSAVHGEVSRSWWPFIPWNCIHVHICEIIGRLAEKACYVSYYLLRFFDTEKISEDYVAVQQAESEEEHEGEVLSNQIAEEIVPCPANLCTRQNPALELQALQQLPPDGEGGKRSEPGPGFSPAKVLLI